MKKINLIFPPIYLKAWNSNLLSYLMRGYINSRIYYIAMQWVLKVISDKKKSDNDDEFYIFVGYDDHDDYFRRRREDPVAIFFLGWTGFLALI